VNQTELAQQIVARARQAGYEVSLEEVQRGFLPAFEGVTAAAIKKGDRVTLPGFGTFERRDRKARTARNPRTGAALKVKATKIPAFKVSAPLKIYVAGGKPASTRAPAWMGMTAAPRGRAATSAGLGGRAATTSRSAASTRSRSASTPKGPGPVKRSPSPSSRSSGSRSSTSKSSSSRSGSSRRRS
jgi:DNA-binding protein HU-beta